MYHSMTFGDKHTYKDWGLVPTSRPVFDPPSPKTTYVDIPGGDGSLDLTEALTGDVKYEMRKGSFEFLVKGRRDWTRVYSEISDYLHGQRMKIMLDDDPPYYYLGRPQVNTWKSEKKHSTITIDAVVDPYKYEIFSSIEDWKWDSFNFETGVVRDYRNIQVDGSLTYNIPGTRKAVVPTFTVVSDDGSGIKVQNRSNVYGWSRTVTLADGTSRNPEIVIRKGNNGLFFQGTGTVTIDYRGARL